MKKFVIIGVVLLVSLSLIYIPSMASINLIGNEEVYLNVNDTYFENGYKTEFLISDLDDKVIITDNINNQKVGSYQVKYTLDWFGRNIQKIRKVNVVDNEAPVIKLQGDSTIYIDQNEKYVEYGYVVYDNVDRQLSKDVIIKSNVDTNKIGKYEILYTITDLSGNTASVTRTVEVVNSNILSAPPKDFWLEGMYEDIILKPKEEYDYLDDMIILGDSNIRYLYKHGNYLGANQVWGKDNLNAVELSTAKVIIHETNEEMLVDEALEKYQPKYLVVSFGFGSSLNLSKNNFIDYSEKFIQRVLKNYPNTKLLVVSLPPIATDTMYAKFQNKTNQFNYYLLELCAKYKIGFINVADELKGPDGYGNPDYFVCNDEYDCGFHLNDKGKELYINYLKKIDMNKEM